MAEKEWTLPTEDGHTIYGVLNFKEGNDKAIIIVHGLTGHTHEYAFVEAAYMFPEQGYDVVRISLYDSASDARKLHECTLSIHAKDTDAVIEHFKGKYKKLYACGHSYGGPTLMLSNKKDITAMSLWDPSYLPNRMWSNNEENFQKIENGILLDWGTLHYIGNDMLDEVKEYDVEWAQNISTECKTPIQTIYAADGNYVKIGESFHTNAKAITDEVIINGTSHCFNEEGTTQPLLDATLKWFNRF